MPSVAKLLPVRGVGHHHGNPQRTQVQEAGNTGSKSIFSVLSCLLARRRAREGTQLTFRAITPSCAPCLWRQHPHAGHAQSGGAERRGRETGRAGSWASGPREQGVPPAMAARLARAACGSLQLLWVGSRDLQKICLLQCGTSPAPFLERAKEGGVRSESSASRCSRHVLLSRFKRDRKRSACKGHGEGPRMSQSEDDKILKWVPFPMVRQSLTQDSAFKAKSAWLRRQGWETEEVGTLACKRETGWRPNVGHPNIPPLVAGPPVQLRTPVLPSAVPRQMHLNV